MSMVPVTKSVGQLTFSIILSAGFNYVDDFLLNLCSVHFYKVAAVLPENAMPFDPHSRQPCCLYFGCSGNLLLVNS